MQSTKTIPASAAARSSNGKDCTVYSIGIAETRIVKAPDSVRTVLGSCIGVAIFDRVAKIGGLGHVILPDSTEGSGAPGKFADTAVDLLVDLLVEAGAERKRLIAKITGGASMFGNSTATGLGERNGVAVRARLLSHAIRLAASDVGGTKGRKMLLVPSSGEVMVEVIGQPARTI